MNLTILLSCVFVQISVGKSKLAPEKHNVGFADDRSEGYFLLRDLTNGSGVFYISRNGGSIQHSTIQEETSSDGLHIAHLSSEAEQSLNEGFVVGGNQSAAVVLSSESDIRLIHGVSFVAGHLEFSVTALPFEKLSIVRMFSAACSGNLPKLKAIIESVATQRDVDINTEYFNPICPDESDFDRFHRFQKSSTQLSVPPSPISANDVSTAQSQPQKLLLHVAVVNNDTCMVNYLLEKGADVSSSDA